VTTGLWVPKPTATIVDTDDDITHTVCCIDEEGLVTQCGLDATDMPWVIHPKHECVVCNDLEENDQCPIFGRCQDTES